MIGWGDLRRSRVGSGWVSIPGGIVGPLVSISSPGQYTLTNLTSQFEAASITINIPDVFAFIAHIEAGEELPFIEAFEFE